MHIWKKWGKKYFSLGQGMQSVHIYADIHLKSVFRDYLSW